MKQNTSAVLLSGCIILLITMSTQAKQGAIQGINLCLQIIIPSLLPVLILTNIINKSMARTFFEKTFGWFTEKILKLPKEASTAVILGLIGGYPTGAVLTLNLFENDLISKKDASRIMTFNFCGGVAFIITAIGEICLSDKKTGIILYCSNLFSAVIIAIAGSAFTKREVFKEKYNSNYLNFSNALVESVDTTVTGLSVMCCYIVFVSAFINIIPMETHLKPLLEITNGLCINANEFSLAQCSAYLAFGGICIHMQLFGILNKMDINIWKFMLFRIVSALISFTATMLYLHFFPQTNEVFGNIAKGVEISTTHLNNNLGIILILGCAVLIFDIEGKKLKLS